MKLELCHFLDRESDGVGLMMDHVSQIAEVELVEFLYIIIF